MSKCRCCGQTSQIGQSNESKCKKTVYGKDLPSRLRLHSTSCFMLLLILLCVSSCFGQATSSNRRFEFSTDRCENGDCKFNLLAVEGREAGNVFIGASNHLFQLSSDLTQKKTALTGPVASVNSLTKILVIDERNERIVVCYNVKHGICELRSQSDISRVLTNFNSTKVSVQQYVAAPSDLSTVAYIATSAADGSQYLYVGSSKTNKDIVDEQGESAYTVSVRSLYSNSGNQDMFSVQLFQSHLYVGDMGLEMKRHKYALQNFRVTFIDGFISGKTGYFVATHPITINDAPHFAVNFTYVSQLCLDDNPTGLLRSYSELQIECTWNRVTYTTAIASKTKTVGRTLAKRLSIPSDKSADVLFVSFKDNNQRDASVVCLYPIYKIEEKFVSLVRSCMKNSGVKAKHISWLQGDVPPCGRGRFTVQSPVCANSDIWDVAQFLQGDSFQKRATYKSSDSLVTAIEVTTTGDSTIALFGTNHGSMIKLKMDSHLAADEANVEYAVENINTNTNFLYPNDIKVLKLTQNDPLSSDVPLVYAMTSNILVGLPLYDCAQYKSCSACLGARDPFCGWCTLESRCLSNNRCSSSLLHGLIKDENSCPYLSSNELTLPISENQKRITLSAHNLPAVVTGDKYQCTFDKYISVQTDVTIGRSQSELTVECDSPPKSSIPPIRNAGFRNVPLSLTYRDRPVVSVNFTYFNCSYHTSCMSCVNSGFGCTWCINDNTCWQTKHNCGSLEDVAQTSSLCPQITAFLPEQTTPRTTTVFLAHGTRKNFRLVGANLPKSALDPNSEWNCEINVPNFRSWTVKADRTASYIDCRYMEADVPFGTRSVNATLRVKWKNNVLIDDPNHLTVVMYKCVLDDENNCGSCLQSPQEWNCGWCDSSKLCTYIDTHCNGDWLKAEAGQACSNPQIDSIFPLSAPVHGDTVITIKGKNFDRQLKMKVYVAGVPCQLLSGDCCKIHCSVKGTSESVGNVSLCITDQTTRCRPPQSYHATSRQDFRFVYQIVQDFSPLNALRGWGTPITFKGHHLDTGNNVTIKVSGEDCSVESRTDQELRCVLPCSSTSRPRTTRRRRHSHHRRSSLRRLWRTRRSNSVITLMFDGVPSVPRNTSSFSFDGDVSISSISPLKTFVSGGLPILVRGNLLSLINNPMMRVWNKSHPFYGKCRSTSSGTLECTSPQVVGLVNTTVPVEIVPGNVACAKTVYKSGLRYVPDPVLNNGDETRTYRGEPIYIFGSNLCPEPQACSKDTVSVRVGDFACKVTRYTYEQIVCDPPLIEGNDKHSLSVKIGDFEKLDAGMVDYGKAGTFNIVAAIAAAIGLALLIAGTVFVVVCVYRRRAHASDQEVKNMQMQMSVMESKVAKVCKEAFAELQTDMTEIDTAAGGAGIPYLQYRNYLLRVLFPDPSTADRHHNLLLSRGLDRSDSRASSNRSLPQRGHSPKMDKFSKLLENKVFMFGFIRTLERQNTFSMKDRANVAGLILVALHDRLQYATEILEQLMSDLIRKSMENRNPKLLFRRTESVAEKMLTHWFSILLHGFVVECAGEPLFTLYRAIKQQVDKGPVDMFTNEARYSLSEDKLLRQAVDQSTITLRVVNYFGDNDQPNFTVKVLSCDSVSQVKRKILDVAYMNVPYSKRPPPDAVDIEWRQDRLGNFMLRDEDSTSKVDGEWKQINTLSHYNVTDGSEIVILPRQDKTLNYSGISTNSRVGGHRHNGSGGRVFNGVEGSNTSLPRHRQGNSRSGTPTLPTEGCRLWHLVKQNDQDNREGIDRGNKMVSEIYLTRLLTTKGTIQKYVDDLFETIFSAVQRGHALPLAVKHMFDFLDHQADIHGITDPEIVHTWKSNCLPLRFWVNLIKNPEFVFDIHKSAIVDCYLSVIAQAFMDSCSCAEYKYGKDSPSNKLLYARDIPNYRQWVQGYYSDISDMQRLNPRDMSAFLAEESFTHSYDFNTHGALTQLFDYVDKYQNDILAYLDSDPEARRQRLQERLEDVYMPMNGGAH